VSRKRSSVQLDRDIAESLARNRTATAPYRVGAETFSSYFAAIARGKALGSSVVEVRADGSEIVRWSPAPTAKARARHVIRNPDGTFTEFGKIRR
jgi:hypothetical protein